MRFSIVLMHRVPLTVLSWLLLDSMVNLCISSDRTFVWWRLVPLRRLFRFKVDVSVLVVGFGATLTSRTSLALAMKKCLAVLAMGLIPVSGTRVLAMRIIL